MYHDACAAAMNQPYQPAIWGVGPVMQHDIQMHSSFHMECAIASLKVPYTRVHRVKQL